MKYNSSKWKHKLRSKFYKFIPPELYVTIMPTYYKFFNKNRRNCPYIFKVEENERTILYDNNGTRFYFMGYRRINNYIYPEGLGRKKQSMKKKYCYSVFNIEPGDIVIDIGANVGEFTLMASQHAEKVFSFEPDPNCFYCLKKNTDNIDNIEIFEYGVSKANDSKSFYLSSEDADSSLIKPKIYTNKIEINTIRLDSWMKSKGISKIDFLKVEAEGAELEVLEGLGDKIEFVQKVSVDGGAERYGKTTSNEVDQYLQSNGFHTYVINHHVYARRK